MRQHHLGVAIAVVLAVSPALAVNASASDPSVQLGPRPFYLVEKMSPSPLKSALQQCGDGVQDGLDLVRFGQPVTTALEHGQLDIA